MGLAIRVYSGGEVTAQTLGLGGDAAENWISLLAWFPKKGCGMRFHSCPGSLIRVTRWSGLGSILRSRQGYKLAFLPWWASGIGRRACVTHSLGTEISQDYADSMARQGHWFCSADGESHGMCSLSKCHC